MKLDWNAKYTTIAAYALIVIFCLSFCIFLFVGDNNLFSALKSALVSLSPVFYGVLIAYLLSPLVRFFEKKLFSFFDKSGRFTLKRFCAVIFTVLVVLIVIAVLVWRLLPASFRGYAELQQMSSFYVASVKEWLRGLNRGEGMLAGYIEQITEYLAELLERLYNAVSLFIPDVANVALRVVDVLKNLLLGAVLAIYFLAAKETLLAQAKKFCHAVLKDRHYASLARGLNLTEKSFGKYLKGQLSDAILMGTLCYLCSLVIGFPYYPLVSLLVGIAYVIPVFGGAIGTLTGALIILLANPIDVIWFVLLMIVLGQINHRLIRPRVIVVGVEGSSVFMLTAMIIMTGLLGFWGLIFGIPIATFLFSILQNRVNRKLEKKGLATDVTAYDESEVGMALYEESRERIASKNGKSSEEQRNFITFTEEIPCVSDEEIVAYEAQKAPDASPEEK